MYSHKNMNFFDLSHLCASDLRIFGTVATTSTRPRYEALCRRPKVLYDDFRMPSFIPPIPNGVEIEAFRTIQGGAAGYEGQWRFKNGYPVNYPDVEELYHYSYISNLASFQQNGILIGRDLARLNSWQPNSDKEEGRGEVFFTTVMDDGKRKPNFQNPKTTRRGVALEPYVQDLKQKDMVAVIDVGAAEASNCRFFQPDSFAVVTRQSVPPHCILRILQWVKRDNFTGWELVHDSCKTPADTYKDRRFLEERREKNIQTVRKTPIVDLTGDDTTHKLDYTDDQVSVIGGVIVARADDKPTKLDWEVVDIPKASTTGVEAQGETAVARTTEVGAEGTAVKKLKELPQEDLTLSLQPLEVECECGQTITDWTITCPYCRRLNKLAKNLTKSVVRQHMVDEWTRGVKDRIEEEEVDKLNTLAETVGVATHLVEVSVDARKRSRGDNLTSGRNNTLAALDKFKVPHQLYRKYAVKGVGRWIQSLKDAGDYEAARARLRKPPGEELNLADRFQDDKFFFDNISTSFPNGVDGFLVELPKMLKWAAESPYKDPNEQYDVTKRHRTPKVDCRVQYAKTLTQEQKNKLGPISNLPGYDKFVEEGRKVRGDFLAVHREALEDKSDDMMDVQVLDDDTLVLADSGADGTAEAGAKDVDQEGDAEWQDVLDQGWHDVGPRSSSAWSGKSSNAWKDASWWQQPSSSSSRTHRSRSHDSRQRSCDSARRDGSRGGYSWSRGTSPSTRSDRWSDGWHSGSWSGFSRDHSSNVQNRWDSRPKPWEDRSW